QKVEKTVTDLNDRAGPILTRVQILLDDTQPKISTMVSDAAHIVYLARGQAQKVDRVFTDAADRLRGQLLHVDRILTGTMEAVEDAGMQFRQGFWRPVQKASALVQGIKVGLDLLRSRRGAGPRRGGGHPRGEGAVLHSASRGGNRAGRGTVHLERFRTKVNSRGRGAARVAPL